MVLVPVAVAVVLVLLSVLSFLLKKKEADGHGGAVVGGAKKVSGSTLGVKKARVGTTRGDGDDQGGERLNVPVLYGTQTNTAEGFARKLATELNQRFGADLSASAIDIEEYDEASDLANEKLVLFCLATYGDGEPTINTEKFHEWITGDDSIDLSGVTYSVFGLGNREYEMFNAMGKKIDSRMEELGGKRLMEVGLGDDGNDIEEDFRAWKEKLWPVVFETGMVKSAADPSEIVMTPEPAYQAVILYKGSEIPVRYGSGLDPSTPMSSAIKVVKELHTRESERSCLHVELDIKKSEIAYISGDHVGIYAENSDENVAEACNVLGLERDTIFVLRPKPGGPVPHFRGPVRLWTALARHADLLTPPKRDSLLLMAEYCSDQTDAIKLRNLGTTRGSEKYVEWIHKQERSLLEVLRAFPSCKPSLDAFFGGIAPRLQPRYYSISSSPLLHPDSIHVTAAVVRGPTPTGRLHEGVCTTWLSRSIAGKTSVPIFLRHSTFRLPRNPADPIIMFGPGTGLAPFRGFLQERQALIEKGTVVGPAVLFYGCRSETKDYIYRDELEGYRDSGAITALHVALSRQPGKQKQYVQDKLVENKQSVWELIESGGSIYVCGDAKAMAKDVHRALTRIIGECAQITGAKAEAFIERMTREGKYHRDVW